MPRSSALKDCNAGLREGVHKLTDCICCDKKDIRRDNFKSHFGTHVRATSAETAEEFATAFSLECIDDVVFQSSGGPDQDKIKYPVGACYACHKVIVNNEPSTTAIFEEHLCKEKKEVQKKQKEEEKMKSPPDFKTLWDTIGKLNMSEGVRTMYDMSTNAEPGPEKYNEMLAYFIPSLIRYAMKQRPSGPGLMSLKKDPILAERLALAETEDDVLGTLKAMAVAETLLVEKHKKEMAKAIKEREDIITDLNAKISVANDPWLPKLRPMPAKVDSGNAIEIVQ